MTVTWAKNNFYMSKFLVEHIVCNFMYLFIIVTSCFFHWKIEDFGTSKVI
jgi:hypothetical protein